MDATAIQAKINYGQGKAAQYLGNSFDVYRAASAVNPLAAPNKFKTMRAQFTPFADSFKFGKASTYDSDLYNGMFDATGLQPWDIFVSSIFGTFFIASLEALVPPFCIGAGRTLTIKRPAGAAAVGAVAYAGRNSPSETTIMDSWPASLIMNRIAAKGQSMLPNDIGEPAFKVIMPQFPGVLIKTSDVVYDDIGIRYLVSMAELSPLGWRLILREAVV